MDKIFDKKYRFVSIIGSGGFGEVYLAREILTNREVAIKKLISKDKNEQDSIIHEIQIVSKFYHPNIVTYHHHFWSDGALYLVMEYCSGGSLRSKINDAKITETEKLKWTETIASALAFVHSKSIIHHDIKPDNILFTEEGEIKLSDFGLANKYGGTRSYMSPEALFNHSASLTDERVDVYALGVTLIELLCGKNPFYFKSKMEIIQMHVAGDFPIKSLPNWQQEIILKCINKVPELRFQTMKDMCDSLKSHQVPIVLDKQIIKAGEVASKIETMLASKKWQKAGASVEFAAKHYPRSVNVLKALGKFYLLQNSINKAKTAYDEALKLNSRLDVQKELGWLNLELGNYPTAISLLSDHLHRNPSDFESYNLLLKCFYETNRYEVGKDLSKTLISLAPSNTCFANNYYLFCIMSSKEKNALPDKFIEGKQNDFIKYNRSVIEEKQSSHSGTTNPTLKSKLVFMDYRFLNLSPGYWYLLDSIIPAIKTGRIAKTIVTIGRAGFGFNDLQVPGDTKISRRHCIIINCKEDVWLYDLGSTGTYLNNEKVIGKVPIIGHSILRIGEAEYTITTDKSKML
jgi:serine/threonine protein kinase